MSYCRIALADENTYSDHAFPSAFMQASSSSARFLYSRKFSSIMKNDDTPRPRSASHMTSKSSRPVR
jgi:hypothetical protein